MPNNLSNYATVLEGLKTKIKSARLRASLAVNVELTTVYWEIGNTIALQEKQEGWGAKIVETLAKDLQKEFSDMTGLSPRNLRYMREFALAYPSFLILQQPVAKLKKGQKSQENPILQQLVAKLPWGHNCVLLDKIKDPVERQFYTEKTIENNWSRNVLLLQIENKLYERKGKAITNFNTTLSLPQADLAKETLKNPYVFDFLSLGEEAKEREIENALIQHLKNFLLELGKGFAYMGNQINIKVGDKDFYLDLLFYNTKLHCYVVFELKVGEFKPDYAGQLNFYLSAVDTQLKGPDDKPTIGVVLCKTPNETVIEYALRGIDKPMGVADFELKKFLPEKLKTDLPTIEELEDELEKEIEQLESPLKSKLDKMKSLLSNLKGDEANEKKNSRTTKKIFESVVEPIEEKVYELLEKEIFGYFESRDFVIWTDNHGHQTTPDVELYLTRNEHVDNFRIEVRLHGFKKAGKNAFDVREELTITLLDYKYQLSFSRFQQSMIEEKLYHQLLNESEITQVAHMIVEKLVDSVNENLERINKYEQ